MICTLYRRHTPLALTLFLIAGILRARAAELPNAPLPQTATQIATAVGVTATSLTGTVTDHDGATIANAHITLTGPSQPATATTSSDGQFTFPNPVAGPFTLSISADDFSPARVTGTLQPGESRDLPAILLTAAASTEVRVTASHADIAQAQIGFEEKQRVLGVFPNFYVSYIGDPEPLNAKQKYELALRTMVDPVSFLLNGATAGIQQAADIYDWGEGAQGFGKRYAAAYGTFLTSDMLGNAVLPTLFKQDPRYFFKNDGTVRARVFSALAQAVVCKGDNHHWQLNYSGIAGGAMAAGLSNAYYPAPNRSGAGLILANTAIGIGGAGLQNIIQQFLIRRLTPHTHPTGSDQP